MKQCFLQTIVLVLVVFLPLEARESVPLGWNMGAEFDLATSGWEEYRYGTGCTKGILGRDSTLSTQGSYSFLTDAQPVPDVTVKYYMVGYQQNLLSAQKIDSVTFDCYLDFHGAYRLSSAYEFTLYSKSFEDTVVILRLNLIAFYPYPTKAHRLIEWDSLPDIEHQWITEEISIPGVLAKQEWDTSMEMQTIQMVADHQVNFFHYTLKVNWDNIRVLGVPGGDDAYARDIKTGEQLSPGKGISPVGLIWNNGETNLEKIPARLRVYDESEDLVYENTKEIPNLESDDSTDVLFDTLILTEEGSYTFELATGNALGFKDLSEWDDVFVKLFQVSTISELESNQFLCSTPGINKGVIRFAYRNTSPTHYNLRIINSLGNEVWAKEDHITNSCGQITYTPLALPAGVYFWVMTTNNTQRKGKLVFIK
jgi:hypothetical protein